MMLIPLLLMVILSPSSPTIFTPSLPTWIPSFSSFFGGSSSSFLTCSLIMVSGSSSVDNNSSKETPYNFARHIKLSVSGDASARSHLLTAWRDNPNLSASSSWERPACFLNLTSLLAISIFIILCPFVFDTNNLSIIIAVAPPTLVRIFATFGCKCPSCGAFYPFLWIF